MDRAIDVALISTFALLVVAKLLAISPEIGVPAAFAAGIANGLRLLGPPVEAKRPPDQSDG